MGTTVISGKGEMKGEKEPNTEDPGKDLGEMSYASFNS